MKKKTISIVLCLFMCFSTSAYAYEFPGYNATLVSEFSPAKGVTYSRYTLTPERNTQNKPQRIFILNVDPEMNRNIRACLALKRNYVHHSKEKASVLAQQVNDGMVFAAVNGDFFDTAAGGPLGLNMTEGRWLTAGEFAGGYAFCIRKDGTALIGQPNVNITAQAFRNGESIATFSIDALNALRSDCKKDASLPSNALTARKNNDRVLYTSDFYSSTCTASGGTEIIIGIDAPITTGCKISGVVQEISHRGNAPLSSNTMVLSLTDSKDSQRADIRKGDTIVISCTVSENLLDVVTATGGGRPDGGPLLLHNGEICTPDLSLNDDNPYFYKRHARTAAGVREDGSWFILVVEAYRTGSTGVTIDVLQQWMHLLGAVEAINLDGGSSSTMVIREKNKLKAVTNTTDSAGQYKVGCALVLFEADGEK